jgi:hypothetical protein
MTQVLFYRISRGVSQFLRHSPYSLHNQAHSDSSQGEVNPDVLDGMSPFEYFCKKRGRGNETLIGFTFE